jgi:hypothetical protein
MEAVSAAAVATMAGAQAQLEAYGLGVIDVRLLALFAAVYTLPGVAMVAATARARSRFTADEDTSAVQVVRLTNRAIASTSMFILPALVLARNLSVWTPWAGGLWCSPLDELQRTLLHMQLMYYIMDTPYTLLKGDVEQIVHHTIGFGLAVPTVLLGACGLPMCAVMFSEQARGVHARSARAAAHTGAAAARAEARCAARCAPRTLRVSASFAFSRGSGNISSRARLTAR